MKRNPVAWAALIVSSAALLSSAGFLRPMPAAPKVPVEGQKAAKALSEAYGAVAEFVRPSVVQISVKKKGARVPNMRGFQLPNPRGNGNGNVNPKDLEEMLKRFFGPEFSPEKEQFGPPRGSGIGSGSVYDNNGHILTNNHVVENSDKITVTFYDGVEVPAKVVGTDPETDVAVIKVDTTTYPPLPRGDSSKLKVGELVMAVGSPFELSQSVTTGIISATERNNLGINSYESFLQTDAPINPGNSGGPLVSMDGQVIGVNSAIMTGGARGNDGVGFAIPIDMASKVADVLIKDGKVHRAAVGIVLAPLTPAMAKQFGLDESTKGVLVNEIVPGSPAEKAGLKQGDVIVGFAGDKVLSLPSFRLRVSSSEISKPFEIVYYRDGQRRTASIVPAPIESLASARAPRPSQSESKADEPAKTSINDFGLEVQALTPALGKSLGLAADVKGLLVSSVKEGSPADASGIAEGDVITKIVRDRKIQPVSSVKEFQDLASKSDELAIMVQSANSPVGRFVTLTKAAK